MSIKMVIAIGGGKMFIPCRPPETFAIDRSIASMARAIKLKEDINFLFIPTASNDDILYCNTMYNIYRLRLGCNYRHLRLLKERQTNFEIIQKINWADIIYVGGGNTRFMMEIWKKSGVDSLLRDAYHNKSTIMTGMSAGSICWFTGGSSDSEKHDGVKDWKPIWVEGLGLVGMEHSPHYSSEGWRKKETEKRAKETGKNILCLDDNCAMVFVDDTYYRVICAQECVNAHIVTPKKSLSLENGTSGLISSLL